MSTEIYLAFYSVLLAGYEVACTSDLVMLDTAIVFGWELMKTVNSQVRGDYLGETALYKKETLNIDFVFLNCLGNLQVRL